MDGAFNSCSSLPKIKFTDTSKVITFSRTFVACSSLQEIINIDLSSATDVYNMFAMCYSLKNISISNIKTSGLSFWDSIQLTHESLLNILNALYDYSDGDTHTITLGATNIAKLTPEELAIGQNKNWTIS